MYTFVEIYTHSTERRAKIMQEQNADFCAGICLDDKRFLELGDYIDSMTGADNLVMTSLQEAQRLFGYVPPLVQNFIAERTGVSSEEIHGLVGFYSQFNAGPKGRHRIGVCLGTACYVRGAQTIMDKVCQILGIGVGETTADGNFTLEATRCLGCCSLAPVMMVDDDVYGRLDDPERIPAILEAYRG